MRFLLLLTFVTTIGSASVKPLVIYGVDNRQEVYEAKKSFRLWAKSTAVLIPKSLITSHPTKLDHFQLSQISFKDWFDSMEGSSEVSLCPDMKFLNQPNPSECSGFLIGPDLLVTAGHCVERENFCEDERWVFDFNLDKKTQSAGVEINKDSIYKCKKVVSKSRSDQLTEDYGVVQLERHVIGRTPLIIRNEAKIKDGESLVVIGSPSGLPTKVSGGANVRDNDNAAFFSANLDTFQGNSGSAVFSADSGVVEGILFRGENDFVPDNVKMCIQVKQCSDEGCRGEDVLRMTAIPEVAAQNALIKAAVEGDVAKLKEILDKNVWVDFYTFDGQSALFKASRVGKVESMKLLIKYGADVNLKDAMGNTPLHELAEILDKENREAYEVLVDAGANLKAKNLKGQTPSEIALRTLNFYAKRVLSVSKKK